MSLRIGRTHVNRIIEIPQDINEGANQSVDGEPPMEYSRWGWPMMSQEEKERRIGRTTVELEALTAELQGFNAELSRHVRNWRDFAKELDRNPRTASTTLAQTFTEIDKEALVRTIQNIDRLEARMGELSAELVQLKASLRSGDG